MNYFVCGDENGGNGTCVSRVGGPPSATECNTAEVLSAVERDVEFSTCATQRDEFSTRLRGEREKFLRPPNDDLVKKFGSFRDYHVLFAEGLDRTFIFPLTALLAVVQSRPRVTQQVAAEHGALSRLCF